MEERFKQQIAFIIEIDKIKNIIRRTKLFDGSRKENDAEHSWHLAIMACVLAEYANTKIDILKVIKMVLIHDLVEISSGDIFLYTENQTAKYDEELKGAEKIFSILPNDQKTEFIELWKEFEERKTDNARFAAALDRLEPIMQNYFNDGSTWVENNVPYNKIMNVNERINLGSNRLWEYAKSMINECFEKEIIK